jgi:predicted Fe-Mo cluster-binding NifX family protein
MAVAKRLKSEGMVAGAPDLVLVDLDHQGRPVAIEMKRARGGSLSTAQLEMHARLEAAGWVVIVGRGCEDAIGQLRAIGIGSALGIGCGRVEA